MICLFLLFKFFFIHHSVHADEQPIHFSGDRQVWDRAHHQMDLYGHASILKDGESLNADHIHFDLETKILTAYDNCVYLKNNFSVFGNYIEFDFNTHTGLIKNGRIQNEKFILMGDKIYKTGENHFKIEGCNYSTCYDCDKSWSFDGEIVDFEVDGYAQFSEVVARVKDVPVFWLPYLILPIKTKRQSGFLFPRTSLLSAGANSNGFMFVLPYYWVMNRSMDTTLGLGEYTARGHRFEWEGRYAFSEHSIGILNAYYLRDRTFLVHQDRWSVNVVQAQSLPGDLLARWEISEVSDNFYPFLFPSDTLVVNGDIFLSSQASLSYRSSYLSSDLTWMRNRALLNTENLGSDRNFFNFDPRTVQVYPKLEVIGHHRELLGNIFGGIKFGVSRFTRTAGMYDQGASDWINFHAFNPGTPFQAGMDPIRRTSRFFYQPSFYTYFRPFDVLSVVPSLEYRGYLYDFENFVPALDRGYLLFQMNFSLQLEKFYDFDHSEDHSVSHFKHLIRPTLNYSLIPALHENKNHPFVQQIQNAMNHGLSGYNFDNQDIVPMSNTQLGANFFIPLGHSLSYGVVTQWIKKNEQGGERQPTYVDQVEWSAGQTLNFLQINQPNFLSRLYTTLNLRFDHLESSTTYYYYPDLPVGALSKHDVSTQQTYIFEKAIHQRILTFERSVFLGYSFNRLNHQRVSSLNSGVNFSINDYWMPYGSVSFGFNPAKLFGASLGLKLQSPSQCWMLNTSLTFNPAQGLTYGFNLALNFTGEGFQEFDKLSNSTGFTSRAP